MRGLKRLKELLTGEGETEKEKPEASEGETSVQKETEKPSETTSETGTVEKKEETTETKPETEGVESEKTMDTEVEKPSEPEIAEEKKVEKPKAERSGSMSLLEREENILLPENIDENYKQEVIDAGAESVALCFQCGTCTGACPSGRRTPYRVRQVVRKSLLGLKDELLADDNLWMCSTCYECQERCPRKIKIVDIIKIARNYAARAGYMGPAHKAVGSFVIKTGHGVPINDATMELRKRVGLGELPPTTHSFPGALEEVQKILKTTEFDKLIGYNWETGELE